MEIFCGFCFVLLLAIAAEIYSIRGMINGIESKLDSFAESNRHLENKHSLCSLKLEELFDNQQKLVDVLKKHIDDLSQEEQFLLEDCIRDLDLTKSRSLK